jgi:hypothetical protein
MQVTTASYLRRFSFNFRGGRHDNIIINCPRSSVDRRTADMAVQFWLGLFPKRNYRISRRCADNPVFNGTVINLDLLMRRLRSNFYATASDLN